MKIYWGPRRSHAAVLEHIEQLERELGIDNEALLGGGPKKREFRPIPDLSLLKDTRHQALVIKRDLTRELLYPTEPGAVIPINAGGSVSFLPQHSSVVTSEVRIVPRPKVELPPGVRLH